MLFSADWDKLGKRAGVLRNEDMAKKADALVLIWDGESRGSANMLETARRYHLKIYEQRKAITHERQRNDKAAI
jgi:hypothetical protein